MILKKSAFLIFKNFMLLPLINLFRLVSFFHWPFLLMNGMLFLIFLEEPFFFARVTKEIMLNLPNVQ